MHARTKNFLLCSNLDKLCSKCCYLTVPKMFLGTYHRLIPPAIGTNNINPFATKNNNNAILP